MTPSSFFSKWDEIISQWYSDKNALSKLMDDGKSLSLDHVPEPYYGNMENKGDCSIVIINLNPGTGLCEQCWHNQNIPKMMVNEIKKDGYSSFAKSFPMLDEKGPEPSVNWWRIRKVWIDRILTAKGVDINKKPFAIELVPLHSKSFKVSDTNEYVKNMAKNHSDLSVIEAIKYAIGNSDAGMGIAVGKPIYDVLIDNGFEVFEEPFQPNSIKRKYAVIGRGRKAEILCTWSSGSNSAPSDNFIDYEKELLAKYFKS